MGAVLVVVNTCAHLINLSHVVPRSTRTAWLVTYGEKWGWLYTCSTCGLGRTPWNHCCRFAERARRFPSGLVYHDAVGPDEPDSAFRAPSAVRRRNRFSLLIHHLLAICYTTDNKCGNKTV